MKHTWKKTLAFLLVLLLVAQLLPVGALAAESHDSPTSDVIDVGAADENTEVLTNPMTDGTSDAKIDPRQEVTFLVELEAKPLIAYLGQGYASTQELLTSGTTAQKAVASAQGQVQKAIQALDNLEILDTYSLLLNGFVVSAPYAQRDALAAIPGVRAVELAQSYEAPEPPQEVAEPFLHTSGDIVNRSTEYTGSGTLVGILDSGLDVHHEAFAAAPADLAMTKDQLDTALKNLDFNAQGNADQLYISDKIPFTYDYADEDADVTDAGGHGTHVTGIVAGNSDAITGMAPDAQIAMFKVFSDTQSGTGDQWVLPALEDAVKLGVDVINMSLGAPCGFSSEGQIMDRVYSRVEDAGIVLMVAGGNEGTATENHPYGQRSLVENPDNAMLGSPSTLDAAISVASVENVQKYVTYFQVGDLKIEYVDPKTGAPFTSLNGTYEYVAVPGYGADSDYAGLNVTGKIALVIRGDLAFTEKEAAAAKAGAAAIVVYDNAPGAMTNMQVEGVIPACFITYENGNKMKAAAQKSLTITSELSDFLPNEAAGQMSTFSSWGPGPNLSLKPEITAPGGHIYSSLPGGIYGDNSGTSMASPHMAGISAGVLQYVNGAEAFQDLSTYRKGQLTDALLMSTAVPLVDPDGILYSPRSQGAGVANMEAAVKTQAYLTSIDGDIAKGELGSSANGSFTFSFYVHNFGSELLRYQVNSSVLVPQNYEENGVAFMADQDRLLSADEYTLTYAGDVDETGKIAVYPGGRARVTVQIELTQKGRDNLAVFPNGIYVEGFVGLEALSEGSVDLGAPFLGFYGDWYQVPIFEPTAYDDETPLTGGTTLGVFSKEDGNGFLLGQNTQTKEYERKYLMISTKYCLTNGVSALVYQLRNARYMRYTVTKDDTQEVYYTNTTENATKSFWYANYDAFYYNSDPTMWDLTCEYEGNLISRVPDGAYTYTIEAWGDGASEKDVQSISLPLVVDSEAPVLRGYEAVEENGVLYLDVELSDNNYLMGAQLTDETGEVALSEGVYLAGDQKGETAKLRFDLTMAVQMGYTVGRVFMLDYAYNDISSDLVCLELGGFQPKSVSLNIGQAAGPVGGTWQFRATVEPAGYLTEEQQQVTWSVSDESIASITQDGLLTGLREGRVVVTATAVNGVSGSSSINFVQAVEPEYTQIPDVTEYTITESGLYQLPQTQSGKYIHLTVDPAATQVTLRGGSDKTYQDLKIHCPGTVRLTLQDVHIALALDSFEHGSNWSYYGAVNFQAMNNVLYIEGDNSITRDALGAGSVSAICVRAKKTEIESSVTFYGVNDGTMTIDVANPDDMSSCYAAAIGGRQGERTGDMTFKNGTWIVKNNGSGAAIGSGTSSGSQYDSELYTSKVTIDGGTFVLDTCHTTTEGGAAIGSGSSGYNGVDVIINGGDITATGWYGGAAIGSGMYGHSSSYAYGTSGEPSNPTTVTINGGTVRAYTRYHEDASAKSPGAAIGSGYRAGASVPVTINGGWVYAETNTESAAIGNATSDHYQNSKVRINGGTVTALTTAEGAAIGGGGATSVSTSANAGIITIDGGSVKARSTGSGKAVGNSAGGTTPAQVWNGEAAPVYEVPIPCAGCKNVVFIGGATWQFSGDHTDDENHYLYLPAGEYKARVYYPDYSSILYQVAVTEDGATVRPDGYVEKYDITLNLTGLTANAPEQVEEGKALSFTMSPERGYGLPETIQVTMGGQKLATSQYTYDTVTGLFSLENVTADVEITAVGVSGIETFAIAADLTHMTYSGPDYASIGKSAVGKLTPDRGYELPDTITVTMGGQVTQSYTYDRTTGAVTVTNVTGDVVISGAAQLIGGRTVTYNLTNLTSDGVTEYVSGQDLEINLTPDQGYMLPETVSVTGEQPVIRYSYNPETGKLIILNATGNLTVTASAVTATIDTAALEAMLEKTKDAYDHPENYKSGAAYDDFQIAYEAAQAVLKDPASQRQVDRATQTLGQAFDKLIPVDEIDTTALAELLERTKTAFDHPEHYVAGADYDAFHQAYEDAQAVLAEPKNQKQVDDAVVTLDAAYEKLEPVAEIDTTKLAKLLDETKDAYDHPERYEAGADYDAFHQAYEDAQAVLAEPKDQKQVDEATDALRIAFGKLKPLADEAKITMNLKGLTSDAPEQVKLGSDLTIQFTAQEKYLLPVSVALSPNEAFEKAEYDVEKGILTITGITGDVTVAAEGVAFAYGDVRQNEWFYDEVAYVTRWGLMNGVDSQIFRPNGTMTRGMVATVLYRMAGSPKVTGTTPFTDVDQDRYYTDAVIWCYQNGITLGVSETRFGVQSNTTRQQIATFLYRYAKFMKCDVSVTGDLSKFPDEGKIFSFAKEALSWAVGTGLMQGNDKGLLRPTYNCTRAETSALLMRFCQNILVEAE